MLFHQYLEQRLNCRPPLNECLEGFRSRKGKHLRPRMFLLCAQPDRLPKAAAHIATGLELLHLASLIHDDLIDSSSKRRGKDALWERKGGQSALLCGDYLFSEAFAEFESSGLQGVLPGIRLLVGGMVRSELEQNQHLFDRSVSEQTYLWRIRLKSARFFSISAGLGAALSGSTQQETRRAYRFGEAFGIAYQLADDLRDIFTGDLAQGIFSLPILWLAKESKEGAKWVGRICRNRRVRAEEESAIYLLLQEKGLLFRGEMLVDDYLRQAGEYLQGMDPWNRDRLRQFLADLRPFLLQLPEGDPRPVIGLSNQSHLKQGY